MKDNSQTPVENLMDSLKERAKELSCIYKVDEILKNQDSLEEQIEDLVEVIPEGWYFPEECQVLIKYNGVKYKSEDYSESDFKLSADIVVQNIQVGKIEVSYRKLMPALDEGPFLKEERKLINTIAQRLSQAFLHHQLDTVFKDGSENATSFKSGENDWRLIIKMLRLTDQSLLFRISRRMLNYMCRIGVEEAKELLEQIGGQFTFNKSETQHDGLNRPIKIKAMEMNLQISERIMDLSSKHISDEQVFNFFQKWIKENKVSFLIEVLENHSSSLADISEAIARYKDSDFSESDLGRSTLNAVSVSLIRRFFSRKLEFINLAKKHVSLEDFYDLTQHLIYPANSNGRLGGKSAGLFVAMQLIKSLSKHNHKLKNIKAPKTWYIASDGVMDFLEHNHLEELLEYKYRETDRIRMEYPNLVQLFKNSSFSPEMIQGIALALDDFGEKPMVVRSSSLLEDSIGAAFSGKYKSLFLANQGSKQERLEALLDAIAEVYSSMFSPDPIEYRFERGLLDFQEEMGIMIQEVVGTRIGKYLCPAFAGVGFSNNEFRWSPRIKRNDGLLRLVPGLGTRAVDRLSDDYPVLVAPGQPDLRVNTTQEETMRYAPRYIDVINLETNSIETVVLSDLIRDYGDEYPRVKEIFSVYKNNYLRPASGLIDFEHDELVATFDGLLKKSGFIEQVRTLINALESHYNMPIDIEFAADDKDFYLLQCRPQSYSKDAVAVKLPKDIDDSKIVFTANKYISNGHVENITHIVYVPPDEYDKLETLELLNDVGKVVGILNKLLPKRQFILIGPGRWGSRGDVKLGVNVTYSEINNTSALIEVAFKKGNYQPDLSFGTHFFQDLVEAAIVYLPLYPDEPDAIFNHEFLLDSPNLLKELLPEYSYLDKVLRVINVASVTEGQNLRILMSAEDNKAMAILGSPEGKSDYLVNVRSNDVAKGKKDQNWYWRLKMAEKIAANIKPDRFDVKAMYVFGSTKNATAGPCSDIDLLIHIGEDKLKHRKLKSWLEGWSLCLGEINCLRTGYETEELLDVHFITDHDIKMRTSFASKIGAISDAAKKLPMIKKKRE